ncbi:hypothetical protein FXN61_00610 [Lentzea sp. PSKA42]|uniref:Uncharacterized protein n=1 Tax=Lentzea indica TaxID=2604800 RepID=A0ABX1F9K2_9PSEU|nr:hypothetical protein [Lentzea indica]NKE55408.1 hypothetical protein [Lentzea indica]
MYVVRDNSRDGKAVSWGTDWVRMDEIAATNPHFEVWPDLGATWHYWHVTKRGFKWVHPYDLDARQHAEIT